MDNRNIKLSTLFIALLILPSVISVVYAHPGKTDSNGGHVDHSTGEYHYHHGYSAHSHYDMDGDSVIDCPYDFYDLTDHSSGTSSSGANGPSEYKSQGNSYSYNYTPKESSKVSSSKVVTKEVPYFPLWAKWTVIISVFVSVCLIFANHSKNKQITALNNDSKMLIDEFTQKEKQIQLNTQVALSQVKQNSALLISNKDEEISKLNAKIAELQTELNSVISTLPVGTMYFPSVGQPHQQLYRIAIPPEIYFINGTVPVRGFISDRTPYGELTVYVALKGRCYHTDPYCGNGLLYARHAYDTIEKLPPCKVCGYRFSESVPEWYFQLKGLPANFQSKTTRTHKKEDHYVQLNFDSYTQS